jgi:hypothetical protein
MKGKEALKIIEQRLKEGHSKGEIFSELTGKVKFRTDLLQLLAMVPEEPLRKKYRNLNILLFTLIVLVGTVKIVIAFFALLSLSIYMVSFEIPIALVSAFFAYMVWNFRGYIYRILGLFAIVGFLKSISNFEAWGSYTATDWTLEFLFVYIPGILIGIVSFYIGIKVFPYYGFWGLLQKGKFSVSA